jgi:hypothetical protein
MPETHDCAESGWTPHTKDKMTTISSTVLAFMVIGFLLFALLILSGKNRRTNQGSLQTTQTEHRHWAPQAHTNPGAKRYHHNAFPHIIPQQFNRV